MTPQELAAVQARLEIFAAEVFSCFARVDQRRWGERYVRGLLTGGARKSMEPMAARLGVDRQGLQQFLTDAPLVAPTGAGRAGLADGRGDRPGRLGGR